MEGYSAYFFQRDGLLIPVRLDVDRPQSKDPGAFYATIREIGDRFRITPVEKTPLLLGLKVGRLYRNSGREDDLDGELFGHLFKYDPPFDVALRRDRYGLSRIRVSRMGSEEITEFEEAVMDEFINPRERDVA